MFFACDYSQREDRNRHRYEPNSWSRAILKLTINSRDSIIADVRRNQNQKTQVFMERLFVYGTLAPGKANHTVLEAIPGSWETATLNGELLDEGWGATMGCPGIVPSEDGEEIEGYVLSSDRLSEHWAMLDEFEGDGYERGPVLVTIESGERIEAYVYALNLGDKQGNAGEPGLRAG